MSYGKIGLKVPSIEASDKNNQKIFYDVCLQAIESNNDKMINKEECIHQINKLKNKSQNKKIQQNKKIPKRRDEQTRLIKSITQKCIDELLEEPNNIAEKNEIVEIEINNNNSENNNKSKNSKEKKQLNEFFKGKQRRYTVLKHINEYLESNDVTMNELIDNNPFQNKPYETYGSYEFIEAVKFGNIDYVNEALIKDDAFLFSIDYYGQTGYHWAAKLGNIKMLDLLIKVGRHHNQKDFKGRTPLYLAAVNNNIEVCKFLLNNGANPFLSDKNGKTPADMAGSSQLREYIKDNMTQPFSNPIYQAKIKRILQDRDKHRNKEGQKKNAKNLSIIMNLFKGKK